MARIARICNQGGVGKAVVGEIAIHAVGRPNCRDAGVQENSGEEVVVQLEARHVHEMEQGRDGAVEGVVIKVEFLHVGKLIQRRESASERIVFEV